MHPEGQGETEQRAEEGRGLPGQSLEGCGGGGSGGVPGELLPRLLNKVQPWAAGAAEVQITQFMSSAIRTSGEE